MTDLKNWPRKVFLESTALFQLGSRLQKPELAKLTERREYLKFELLVSEVSWAEYLRQRLDKIEELTRDLQAIETRLGEWDQNPANILTTHSELEEFRKGIGNVYEKRAAEAGIHILGIPTIDVARLFKMSIERIPPFEKSRGDKTEKGFRDSLIMFTILESIRGRPGDYSLIVTKDDLLSEGLAIHAAEFKTELAVVSDLDAAIAHIDARVDVWYRDHLLEESEQAKSMLGSYTKEIGEQVNQVRELTELDLGVSTFLGTRGDLETGESVERVNSLTLEEIESAVWKDRNKSESRILFRIHCAAQVTTKQNTSSPFWWTVPTYPVGRDKPPSSFLQAFSERREEQRERTLSVWLYGEADFKRTNGDWELLRIKVDRSQPAPEEMATLLRIPHRKT